MVDYSGYIFGIVTALLTIFQLYIFAKYRKIDKKLDENYFWYRTIFILDNGVINKIYEFKFELEKILKSYSNKELSDEEQNNLLMVIKKTFRPFDENFFIIEVMSKDISNSLMDKSMDYRDKITELVAGKKYIQEYDFIIITNEYTKLMLTIIYNYSKAKKYK